MWLDGGASFDLSGHGSALEEGTLRWAVALHAGGGVFSALDRRPLANRQALAVPVHRMPFFGFGRFELETGDLGRGTFGLICAMRLRVSRFLSERKGVVEPKGGRGDLFSASASASASALCLHVITVIVVTRFG